MGVGASTLTFPRVSSCFWNGSDGDRAVPRGWFNVFYSQRIERNQFGINGGENKVRAPEY